MDSNKEVRPAYWKLDLWMVLMLALLGAMVFFGRSWLSLVGIAAGWMVLCIIGMAMWLWNNAGRFQYDERWGERDDVPDS